MVNMSDCAGVEDETMVVIEPSIEPKKKAGNPRWAKGVSGNPKGREKGSKNYATLAREALIENKHDPVKELLKDLASITDPKVRARINLQLIEWFYEPQAKTTNVNVNEKSVQIIWTHGTPKSEDELLQMRVDLGLIESKPTIEGELIEATDDMKAE